MSIHKYVSNTLKARPFENAPEPNTGLLVGANFKSKGGTRTAKMSLKTLCKNRTD